MNSRPLWVLTNENGFSEVTFDEPTAKTKAHYSRKGRTCVVYWPEQPTTATTRCKCDELTRNWRWEDRAALCGHIRGCPLHGVE